MRSLLTATLIFVAIEASAKAQMTAPATLGTNPKPVATTPIIPPIQAPADTAAAMTQGERLKLQSDLAWVGLYNGAISGDASSRMVNAVKEFQKQRSDKPTGALNPKQRTVLADTAKRRQANVGWKIVTDAGTGAQLGIPAKLVPQQSGRANGAKWSAANGAIQVVLSHRKENNPTKAKLAEREKNNPPGRTIGYTVIKPDFFVLSGAIAPLRRAGIEPFRITGGAAKSVVELTGIADRQNQGGGSAASQVKSSTAPIGDGDLTLSPAPALGFSGSPALDDTGTFAGIALLKPIVSAGPTSATKLRKRRSCGQMPNVPSWAPAA